MKHRKILAAAAAMMLAVCGCGQTGEVNVEALLEKAEQTMEQVESISAEMQMDMTMGMAGGESVESITKTTIQTQQEPLRMQMDMTVLIDGEEEVSQMQMYALEEAGMLKTYMYSGDTWYTETMDMDALAQYNAEENMDLYLDCISKAKAEGTETVSGTKTTKISGVITGEDIEEAMEVSGIAESALSLGVSTDMLADMYAELGELPLCLWIDDDGYVWKYELDMTAIMQQIMDFSMAAMGMAETDTGIQIEKAMVRMECLSFNDVAEIEIPAEALDGHTHIAAE